MGITLKQFVEKYQDKSVDFDKKYGAQCVDLFNFYNAEVVGAPFIGTPVTGGARDLFEVSSPAREKFYEALSADSQMQAGDVPVYGAPNGRYVANGRTEYLGHVRIYLGDSVYIEQNGKIAGKTIVGSDRVSGIIGILRPRTNSTDSSTQDASTPPQNKNKYTIQPADTFWDLEKNNGWPTGTLQELNPALDPKKLQIGSEITIPTIKDEVKDSAERYYVIKQGDTFWALENAWQLSHGRLQELNPTAKPRELAIGQRIRIA